MTFPEILDAIDTLSDDQLAQLKQRITHRESKTDQPDLSAFEALSDEALWAIVDEPFLEKGRIDELHDLRDIRRLTDAEEEEFDSIMKLADKQMIRRSMAMVTLQKRGADVLAKIKMREER